MRPEFVTGYGLKVFVEETVWHTERSKTVIQHGQFQQGVLVAGKRIIITY